MRHAPERGLRLLCAVHALRINEGALKGNLIELGDAEIVRSLNDKKRVQVTVELG